MFVKLHGKMERGMKGRSIHGAVTLYDIDRNCTSKMLNFFINKIIKSYFSKLIKISLLINKNIKTMKDDLYFYGTNLYVKRVCL